MAIIAFHGLCTQWLQKVKGMDFLLVLLIEITMQLKWPSSKISVVKGVMFSQQLEGCKKSCSETSHPALKSC